MAVETEDYFMGRMLKLCAEVDALKQQLAAANALLDQRFEELAAAREELDGCKAALHIACGERSLAREALQAAEANAARYLLIAKRWQHQKTSESELLLMTLGLDGDVTGQLDDIIDATLQRDRQP